MDSEIDSTLTVSFNSFSVSLIKLKTQITRNNKLKLINEFNTAGFNFPQQSESCSIGFNCFLFTFRLRLEFSLAAVALSSLQTKGKARIER